MHLQLFTDISLKALMYIREAKSLVNINEIANKLDISKNHLTKALNSLVKMNLINSVRGRNGGLQYNSQTDNIALGNLIKKLEKQGELLNCSNCILSSACFLRQVLYESQELFYDNLNRYTIKSISTGITQNLLSYIIKKPE